MFALLFFPFSVFAKSQVASVFVNSELCPGKICLHGEFKQGTKILLLSNQDNKTCAAKVGKKIRVEYTPGPFDASEIIDLKKCKVDSSTFFLAIIGRNQGKLVNHKSTAIQTEQLNDLDKRLKLNSVFIRAWKKEVFHISGDPEKETYKLKDYKKLSPVGYSVKLKNKEELNFVRHTFTDGSNEGILFSFYKKKWTAVSSSFTVQEPVVFTLDGRLFVISKVSCQMKCGYLDNEVFEFNGRVFKMIYNNADFSS